MGQKGPEFVNYEPTVIEKLITNAPVIIIIIIMFLVFNNVPDNNVPDSVVHDIQT